MRIFNPSRAYFRVQEVVTAPDAVVVVLAARRQIARCPSCTRKSQSVHSRYTRKAWDLPCVGRAVRLLIRARKFFCLNTRCRRRIFTERFQSVIAPYARRTERSMQSLLELAHLGSAEHAARVARLMGFPVSPDSLIRMQRSESFPSAPIHALGVDEFSWRRGRQRYGSILVDLDLRRPIDLLPTDSVDIVKAWMEKHLSVAIITRDRDAGFALAARGALPDATQIADRFHLIHNVHQAFQSFVDSRRWRLPAAIAVADEESVDSSVEIPLQDVQRHPTPRKQQLWERVQCLKEKGHSLRQIARALRINRATARKYAVLSAPLVYPKATRPAPVRDSLQPFLAYLKRRWHDDHVHNLRQLHMEVQDLGFKGGLTSFRIGFRPPSRQMRAPPRPDPWPLVRRFVLFVSRERWTADERSRVRAYFDAHPLLASAFAMRERFLSALRQRQVEDLLGWIEQAARSYVPTFRSMARGLRRDIAAVRASLLFSWSNGQVEGQVNRLKLIKRLAYGRANPDLLRARVLHRVPAA